MTLLHRREAMLALGSLVHCRAWAAEASPPLRSIGQLAPWTAATPVDARPPAVVVSLIRPEDVLTYAAPGRLYPIRNIGLQCQGTNSTLADVRQLAVETATSSGRMAQRFGEVNLAARRAFRLQASAEDSLAPDASSRCELVSYPMPGSALPRDHVFWLAFTFWVDDWSGSTDEQSIAQMHIEEPRRAVLNPFFAMVVRGDELRIELRHNASQIPDRASSRLHIAKRMTMPVRRWVTAVVQAKLGADGNGAPFLRLWLNDALVADYAGPFGYMLGADGHAYWKVGIYHWAAGNAWDNRIPERAMLLSAMLSVKDPDQRYTNGTLRAAATQP